MTIFAPPSIRRVRLTRLLLTSPPGLVLALALLTTPIACRDAAVTALPPEVIVTEVEQRDVPVVSEWIGTTEGAVDAEVRAQVTGNLLSRNYQEGTLVKKGDLLFKIDPREYRAVRGQASGELARARAMLQKAKQDVERYTPLAAQGAISQQELDNAIQTRRAAEASVQAAQATLEKGDLDVSFTEVRSPIDGIAGVARAQIGNLVGPSDPEPLTRVSKVDPIRVSFPLSEREYLKVAERIRDVVAGSERRGVQLELVLTDGSTWIHPGFARPASEAVDANTGTLLVRGEFPNPENILRPGQYARVRATTDVVHGALVVPQRAVIEMQGVYQVAVVGDGDKVALRVVEPGIRTERGWVIAKGLARGERVVVEGLEKVRDGVVVTAKAAPSLPAVASPPPAAPPPAEGAVAR
jgi:RND family efflux transporter, MFP subunit